LGANIWMLRAFLTPKNCSGTCPDLVGQSNQVSNRLEPKRRTEIRTPPASYVLPAVTEMYRDGIHLRQKEDGRYLLLRGVCLGPNAKYAPFLPIERESDWPKFEPYLRLLLACGFYTLRLAFSWEALEPTCDPVNPQFNLDYLDAFTRIVDRLTAFGFLIYIDIHQDLVQAAYGGNGFPPWVKEDGAEDGAFMMNTSLWGLNYVMNKGLRRTFTHFWKNDLTNTRVDPPLIHFPVRDRLLDVIELLAERCALNERVFGIEIINEPHPAELPTEDFESHLLSQFYEEARLRIRKHSNAIFVIVSPQSDWNVNLREDKNYRSLLTASSKDDDRISFGYHYYDSLMTGLQGLHFHDRKREEYMAAIDLGVQHSRGRGLVPFLTEFGSRQNWIKHVTRRHMHWHFEAVERAMVHATYWNVNFYNTKKNRDGFMREDFSLLSWDLKPRNLDIAVRPYPIAASAKPHNFFFNDRTRVFDMTLSGPSSDAETVLYVPFSRRAHELVPVHYPQGFKVYYGAGRISSRVTALPESNQLHIKLDPIATTHHLMIVPTEEHIIANKEQLIFEWSRDL